MILWLIGSAAVVVANKATGGNFKVVAVGESEKIEDLLTE
jgi:hypothetical protein